MDDPFRVKQTVEFNKFYFLTVVILQILIPISILISREGQKPQAHYIFVTCIDTLVHRYCWTHQTANRQLLCFVLSP